MSVLVNFISTGQRGAVHTTLVSTEGVMCVRVERNTTMTEAEEAAQRSSLQTHAVVATQFFHISCL